MRDDLPVTLERNPAPLPAPAVTQKIPLGQVRLTLDDLDDVLQYLRKAGKDPILTAGYAVASEAQALKSATRDELNRVAIRTGDESASITLWRGKAVATYDSSDEIAASVVGDVARLLAPRRLPGIVPWLMAVAKGFAVYGAAILVLLGIAVLLRAENIDKVVSAGLGPMLLILAGTSVALGSLTYFADGHRSGGAKVLPYFRQERREITFSAGQAWLIGTVTAVLSGAIGAVVTWFLTRPSA